MFLEISVYPNKLSEIIEKRFLWENWGQSSNLIYFLGFVDEAIGVWGQKGGQRRRSRGWIVVLFREIMNEIYRLIRKWMQSQPWRSLVVLNVWYSAKCATLTNIHPSTIHSSINSSTGNGHR